MKKNNILKVLSVAGMMLFSQSSFATGYPVIDVSLIAKVIEDTVQSARQHAEEMLKWDQKEQMDAVRHGEMIDNDNNRSANEINRVTQVQADLHNLEEAKDALASSTACVTEDAARRIEDAQCESEVVRGALASASVSKRQGAMRWNKDSVAERTPAVIKQEMRERVNEYEQRFSRESSPAKDYPVRADAFFGSTDGCFLEGTDQYLGMQRFIENVTVPVDGESMKHTELGTGTDIENEKTVKKWSKDAKMNVAQASLQAILASRYQSNALRANGTECDIAEMKKFAKTVWQPSTSQGPSQVTKSIQEIDGFIANVAAKQYEQSLRMETLMAVMLADQLKSKE